MGRDAHLRHTASLDLPGLAMRTFHALCFSLLALSLGACSPGSAPADGGSPADLEVRVLTPGDGAVARNGDRVEVHYTGWLFDERQPMRRGAEFDSSRARSQAFSFTLGVGQVIRGWDEGVVGMRIGEVRELAIPSDLAYGQRGAGRVIPPHQPLLFEIELLAITPGSAAADQSAPPP